MTFLSKIYRTRYSLLLMTILATSCSDFLYVEPDKQISIGEQFSTKEGLLQTVNGAYKSLEALVSGQSYVYADVQAGNIAFLPTTSKLVEVPSSYEYSYDFDDIEDDSDYESFYTDVYDVINQTNVIIEHLYDSPDTEDEVRQQIKAEMLAMRGYAHFITSLLYSQNMQYTSDGNHLGIVYNRRTLTPGIDL